MKKSYAQQRASQFGLQKALNLLPPNHAEMQRGTRLNLWWRMKESQIAMGMEKNFLMGAG